MRKLHFLFTSFLLITILSFVNAPKEGLDAGDKLPTLLLKNSHNEVLDLKPNKGEFVIVNFWASYDAESRMRNVKLYNAFRKMNLENYRFVSVSLDPSTLAFQETIQLDGIEASTQFLAPKESNLYTKFRLQEGFASFLINDKGVIISSNFDDKQLNNL